MGRVVATEFISVDGVFEDPGGSEGSAHGAWTFEFDRGDDATAYKVAELAAADAQLLGRVTYEGFAAAWPQRSGDEFSDKFNAMPKYVVSASLTRTDWNNSSVIAPADLATGVARLKAQYAGDTLIAGSGQLVRSLIAKNLLDKLHLMVFPVILVTGKRLFDGAERTTLRLTATQQVGSAGVTILTYEPAAVTATTGTSVTLTGLCLQTPLHLDSGVGGHPVCCVD